MKMGVSSGGSLPSVRSPLAHGCLWALLLAALVLALPVRPGGMDARAGEAADDADAAAEAPAPQPSASGKALVLRFHGVIIPDDSLVRALVDAEEIITDVQVDEALDKAEADGASLVVLEIDSPGGVVSTVNDICARILECPVQTVALITNNAISGAAITASACDELVMVEGTTIGDAEPHMVNQKLPDHLREKIESPLRARVRANAEANGYPPKLLEAMVTKSIKLYRVTYADGTDEFLDQSELDLIEKQIEAGEIGREIFDREIICNEGELLTLTHGEAVEYGLAKKVVDNVEAFYAGRDLGPDERLHFQPSEPEEAIGWWKPSPFWIMVLVLCIVLGVAGAVVEAGTPGFGLGGIVSILGFASFFSIFALHGTANDWEIVLFVVGLVLVLAEIFLIPGFGVAGIAGILCVGASLLLVGLPPIGSDAMQVNFLEYLGGAITILGLGALLSLVAGYFLVKYYGTIPVLSKIVHGSRLRSGAELWEEVAKRDGEAYPHEVEDEERRTRLVGVEGVATTDLRPGGKVRTDAGELLDVVAESGLIPVETKVRVTDVNGPRVTVIRAE
jgi:membrane-bound serine protease (ClpP class)